MGLYDRFRPLADIRSADTLLPMTDYDLSDKWQDEWMGAVYRLGELLAEKHQTNPWPHISLLPEAMRYLMTELWDRGFSLTEIRAAFEAAVLDLPGYAVVEKRP